MEVFSMVIAGALLSVFVPFRLKELDELLFIVLLEQYLAITCRASTAERLLELAGEVCQIAIRPDEAHDDECLLASSASAGVLYA